MRIWSFLFSTPVPQGKLKIVSARVAAESEDAARSMIDADLGISTRDLEGVVVQFLGQRPVERGVLSTLTYSGGP